MKRNFDAVPNYHRDPVNIFLVLKNARIIFLYRLRRAFSQLLGLPGISLSITLSNEERGFFSLLSGYVDLIEYCNNSKLEPNVFIQNLNYHADGEDLLESLFEMTSRVPKEKCTMGITIRSADELPFFRKKTLFLGSSKAKSIVREHLRVKKFLGDEIDRFIRDSRAKHFVGIHWRGTDHISEADPVELDQILETLNLILINDPSPRIDSIFISSDEELKINSLASALGNKYSNISIFYSNSFRSSDGNAIHLGTSKRVRIEQDLSKDALFDCLVLSQSRVLIRVASNLSAWCSLFNPDIASVKLSEHKPNLNYYEWRWMD